MHSAICKNCGKKTEYKYKSICKTFCSGSCASQWMWDNNREKAERVTLKCAFCDNEFSRKKSFLKKHPETKYCSVECMAMGFKKNRTRKCKKCGKEFETYRAEHCSKECATHTHNMTGTRQYKMWENMKLRCYNKSTYRFDRYGERGITVCDEWKHDFAAFYKWAMNNGYDDSLSLDRIDNDGNYSPDNCRFADQKLQSRNSRRLRSTNTSGFRGVQLERNRWQARATVNYKNIYIGVFTYPWTAALARDSYIIMNSLEHTLNYKLVNV